MNTLISIKLKNEISFLAILLQETESHISVYTKKLGFSLIDKEDISKTRHIRTLDKKEQSIIKSLIELNTEIKDFTAEVEQIQKCIKKIENEKNQIEDFVKVDIFAKKKSDESFIRMNDIEDSLSKQGYKNLLALQKSKVLDYDKDDVILLTIEGETFRLSVDLAKVLVNILNQYDAEQIYGKLAEFVHDVSNASKGAQNPGVNFNKKQETDKKDAKYSLSNINVNMEDIKHLLSEVGYKTLKDLQHVGLLKFHNNNDISVNIPFMPNEILQEVFKDKKSFADMLNGKSSNSLFNEFNGSIFPMSLLNLREAETQKDGVNIDIDFSNLEKLAPLLKDIFKK